MSQAAIRWIAFDVVGTLIFADPPVHMAYHRIGREFGSQLDPMEIRRRFREALLRRESAPGVAGDLLGDALSAETTDVHQTSEAGEHEFWRGVVAEVLPDVRDPVGCYEALFEHFAQPAAWGCFMDVEEIIPWLKAHGYRLALASNFDARLHTLCAGHPVLGGIEVRVISSEVGHRKPSPRFFEALSRACATEPGAILMIGDHFQHDVLAARAAGLQALHLDRSGQGTGESLSNLLELPVRLERDASTS